MNLSPSLAFESPLDLKIKGSLIKDLLNLIGLRKPPEANEGLASAGNPSSAMGDTGFFKGKVSGKVLKNTHIE